MGGLSQKQFTFNCEIILSIWEEGFEELTVKALTP